MRDIDLVPKKQYNANVLAKKVMFVIISTVLASVMIFYAVISPLKERRAAEQAYAIHQKQMDKLEDVITEHEKVYSALTEVAIRKENIKSMLETKIPASLLVSSIDGSLPEGVRIFSKTYDDDIILVEGEVKSPLRIADFLVVLKKTELFESVRILNIRRDQITNSHSFNMNLTKKEVAETVGSD